MDNKLEIQSQSNERALVGRWKRIGATGPIYQIVGVMSDSTAKPRVMTIRFPETGEVVEYPLSAILDDPEED